MEPAQGTTNRKMIRLKQGLIDLSNVGKDKKRVFLVFDTPYLQAVKRDYNPPLDLARLGFFLRLPFCCLRRRKIPRRWWISRSRRWRRSGRCRCRRVRGAAFCRGAGYSAAGSLCMTQRLIRCKRRTFQSSARKSPIVQRKNC